MSRTKHPTEPKQDANREPFEELSAPVQNRLRELDLKLRPFYAAQRLWNRLNAEQREHLGGDTEAAYRRLPHAARLWAELHQVNQFRAYLEAGKALGFVSDTDFAWLMQEIGESPDPEVDANRPRWNADLGELSLNGDVIGKFRIMKSPSVPCRMLAAFQDANWRTVVDEPLGGGEKTLQDAVRYLNAHIEHVRFRTQRGGQAISWERR